jgi:LAO/AO transport system kinase
MEMADAVINKADGDNIKKESSQTEFNRALHLFPAKKSGWTLLTAACSAITNEGIGAVWKLFKILGTDKGNNYFFEKRKEQNQYWMLETINEQLKTISTNIQKFKAT